MNPLLSGVTEGDSVTLMRTMPSSSAHLILSDIPYGISADDWDVLHDNTNSALLDRALHKKKLVRSSRSVASR